MKRQFYAVMMLVMLIAGCRSSESQPQPVPEYVPAAPYGVFHEGMIANITPEGWLKEILLRQKEGLTGHPEAMAYPYDSCLWAGELSRDSENRGSDWWRYEQTAYYLDGLTRLGFLLEDQDFLNTWQENIDYVLEHPQPYRPQGDFQAEVDRLIEDYSKWVDFSAQVSEDPKARAVVANLMAQIENRAAAASEERSAGRLGSDTEFGAWPFAVFFRAVQAYYEATGDPRIPEALEKHFLSYSSRALSLDRFVVNVEGLLWTYSLTGNKELLQRAVEAWGAGMSALTQESCLDDSEFHMHGVTMTELLKVPMLLYMHTGEQQYLQAALKAMRKMETPNMLIDGVNSSTEALAGNDPLASHETCDISDYTWTVGYYLMGTGEAKWADRIEKAIFNAGLGAVTKDFRTMQYFSCPNQFIATGSSNHNDFKKGLTWMAYRPVHETECCIGNVHRYFPNYVARMWLKDAEGQPVAALYGPSSVVYDLGDGVSVQINEKTGYPFEEKIDFEFTFYVDGRKSDDTHEMDFTYRIPEWCDVSEGSGFHTVSKEWKSGDVFTVNLPMEIEFIENSVAGMCIQRGPVVYSYSIPSKWEEDTQVYDYLAGKVSGNPDFKCWNIYPDGKWNWALVEDKLDEVKVEYTGSEGFPFDVETVPVKITVPVVGVKDWVLDEDRYTPALPETVVPESDEVSYITLVPYGSTTLRLTTFPVAE